MVIVVLKTIGTAQIDSQKVTPTCLILVNKFCCTLVFSIYMSEAILITRLATYLPTEYLLRKCPKHERHLYY